MGDAPLTLMAVHAHPDDEVLGTGGLLARSAAEGIRTVLVTCTNGEQGDGAGGAKPGEPGHDEAEVVAVRRRELERSCSLLDVGRLELLGYRDSGMAGWTGNERDDAFCNVPLDAAADRVAELMERYRPQVVVTYDENGNYGHPDHIQAHRVAVAAAERTGIPQKVYFVAFPRSGIQMFVDGMRAMGIDPGEMGFDPDADDVQFGVADEMIGAVVDVGGHIDRKREALLAHASQSDNFFLLKLPDDAFRLAFGAETFVRHRSTVSFHGVEDDLFFGLR